MTPKILTKSTYINDYTPKILNLTNISWPLQLPDSLICLFTVCFQTTSKENITEKRSLLKTKVAHLE